MISLINDCRIEDRAGDVVVVTADANEVDEVADDLDGRQEDPDRRYQPDGNLHFDRVTDEAWIG